MTYDLTYGDRCKPAEDDENVDPSMLVLVLWVRDGRRHCEIPAQNIDIRIVL